MHEANPVISFLIEVHPYAMISFIFLMWGLMYYVTVHQSQLYGRMIKHVGLLCLALANIWLAIDAAHDLYIFLKVI